ncbi:carbamoyl-phosphate synthase (glutamine-hydrolyzing) cpa2 [Elasticomyces elasticus]|uniref:Carbamoyl-phosphate synthase (Glutamine-hydrolyzing) cpa2 n=1 Tax=Exophiala sideris TaxID=1016849 RepID=A0ABR0J076_9EURO|nr:carbamoyl-phosphate synthase (glutamine-hydrolyzing) cpa2 [Elasticomyces elasticus]KAK5023223.1 carbamoyl-phosphate synthase (glutamine-hydrolyzing) cpa2 [Exophiala sideris]KAK5028595.1 carbamoyl-phosphate synthase (glutamine-hydrolyzing) cpa2 [Exophiala sideris]KAK5052973.1 carbamoyl-phosphate synthase (glutamine-hydrolyzing) cpa2 [Exophiala sideris]KAK5178713.1 carbamoyl-phosphate synthase (glutamine-hydrolyzing) cpa2 [Eurotiomycetes sp. CCFEE 6388]
MAFQDTALFQVVILAYWTCLNDTHFNAKNPLFARFFTSEEDLNTIAAATSLMFCPGLWEVIHATTPPTIEWFKGLPTCNSLWLIWGVYLLVLEKDGCRPLIYIGSGTSAMCGVIVRFKQYDDLFLLPLRLEEALEMGYIIVHKGLLCWIDLPTAAQVPVYRLLFHVLEATFSYMFWAMYAKNGDYGMGHIRLWDREAMEYDGLCSHCCLNEGIRGDFDLTAEQLEAQAIEKEKKRLELKKENATNHHYKQMAENYDEYITQANERVQKSRANNPEKHKETQNLRAQKAIENNTHHCDLCNLSFTTKLSLKNHLESAKHLRKAKESDNPFRCAPCNLGFHNKSNLNRHEKSDRHRKAVAATVLPSPELD